MNSVKYFKYENEMEFISLRGNSQEFMVLDVESDIKDKSVNESKKSLHQSSIKPYSLSGKSTFV